MKTFIVNYGWWITFLASIILLIAHSLSIATVQVDMTSVVLLAILLISPFISNLKKIKVGEFEAEINPKEIQKVKADVETLLPTEQANKAKDIPEFQLAVDSIKTLVQSDHILALAKIRIELEKLLNRLYRLTHIGPASERALPIGKLVHDLTSKEILTQDMSAPIREVISLCNRAVHGEDIRKEDAESIVEIATSLISNLFGLISNYIVEPNEVIPIDSATVDEYMKSMYRVTTVVPYVHNPVKNIRLLNQEGLDNILEGYDEYAEFIVEVVKL